MLLELDELLKDLDQTLNKALCISSYGGPFHFENQATPNYFGGLDIHRRYITNWDTSSDYFPKISCGGKYQLFIQILGSNCPSYLPFAE
jgi:hypothetical protein